MRLTAFPLLASFADAGVADWPRYALPVLVTVLVGLIGWICKPVFVKIVHYFFNHDPSRATDTVLEALATKAGKVRMKALMEDIFEREIREHQAAQEETEKQLTSALQLASANSDSLKQIDLTTKTHSMELKAVREALDNVPRMGEALERISESIETFAGEMRGVRDFMSRADERERIRAEERRLQQVTPHPKRRVGDS